MKICVVIPAYNEAMRIGKMLTKYATFFEEKKIEHEFIVVLNGCKDNTFSVVKEIQKKFFSIQIINLTQAGKGLAVATGFKDALKRKNDLIGFVDADMATRPEQFYDLIKNVGSQDGIIASRYMRESKTYPSRPFAKEWVRVLFYNPLVHVLFGMRYKDFQCGAKLFRRSVVEKIIPYLTVRQWAFDVELLYLCRKNRFKIKERPTVWRDQDGSKLKVGHVFFMFGSLFKLRLKR